MASVVIASKDRRGDRHPLEHGTNVIGRAESLLIQILDDLVLREHLQIRFDPMAGRYSILDMGGENGVSRNGVTWEPRHIALIGRNPCTNTYLPQLQIHRFSLII
jgi:pSer/pThr/pTyr-binding forkhead associated (FHA) protein